MTLPARVKIHMIGHAHIDPTWLWPWTEGYQEVRATFRGALDRMQEHPQVCFTASSALFYYWIKESEPAVLEQIRRAVEAGRWEPVGGLWIEPDCNLPSGESFARQGYYGQRFFKQIFGKPASVAMNPDSFGHAATLPQIFKKLGMAYYVFMRPMADVEKEYPESGLFFWRGIDGTQILTANIFESYNADDDILARIDRLIQRRKPSAPGAPLLCFFGVGNHGGGPTRRAIMALDALQQDEKSPQPVYSTLARFFKEIEETLPKESIPVVQGELQHHARGCYSAHASFKRLFRHTEHALLRAERSATLAHLLLNDPYPQIDFSRAWRTFLYTMFHDILAGTSIPAAYEDARDQLGAARTTAHRIINRAVQRIAANLPVDQPGVLVVNSLPWFVQQPVCVSDTALARLPRPFRLLDESGTEISYQQQPAEYPGGKQYRFLAHVPPFGYRFYRIASGSPASVCKDDTPLVVGADSLENAWWRIEVCPITGTITRLYDKQHARDLLERGALLECLADASDTWSHGVSAYRVTLGTFRAKSLTRVAQGPVFATVRVHLTYARSEAFLDITLYRDIPQISLDLQVNWQEKYTVLKFGFATRLEDASIVAEIPYGYLKRPMDGEEQPFQQWLALRGRLENTQYYIGLVNDGVYAYDAHGAEVRLTLLRSPAYAHHDPAPYRGESDYPIMDQGWHRWKFIVWPCADMQSLPSLARLAWELHNPPEVLTESVHAGTLPQSASLCACEQGSVLVTAVKMADTAPYLIVRGYEYAGESTNALIILPELHVRIRAQFHPFEIKTFAVDPQDRKVTEVSLLEDLPEKKAQ